MSERKVEETAFEYLGLSDPVLKALKIVGYESPSPVQAQVIPPMLEGRDVVGQAQTGTGKTAAFALPLLSRIDLSRTDVQVMVLTPTRELAIQVAEAFQQYAAKLRNFYVLPIYGGQDYKAQFRRLSRGAQVIVGTPGRVMDHLRRGTLNLRTLQCLVLDEADEMLRMGFIDDVQWIMDQTPDERQVTLFSATMPPAIRKIAKRYLKNPVEVTIKAKTATVETTRQRYWMVSGYHKLDALTRILEAEPFDGVLIFVRTKTSTVELSEKLAARGFLCAPLSGDIPQSKRERTVEQFKSGKLNLLVATDVAARGLDVDRISHVINYDIPSDTEAYVHRIGRTGRAGRRGDAILFVAPRERHMLRTIEKATRQRIEMMDLPSTDIINNERIARFKQRITDTLALEELGLYYQIVEQYRQEHNIPAIEIAAALARLVQGDTPLLLTDKPVRRQREEEWDEPKKNNRTQRRTPVREEGMESFRVEVGFEHGVKPANLVGAIANEAGIDSDFIGRIEINDEYSIVDLPQGIPDELIRLLKKVYVCNRRLKISRIDNSGKKSKTRSRKKSGFKEKSRRSKKYKN